MKLTYNIDIDGRKIAPDGTIISDNIADAVNHLAYLEGWATNVQPPDLGDGAKVVRLFAHCIDPVITIDQMRGLVQACDIYGVEHRLNNSYHWCLDLQWGNITVQLQARAQQPQAVPQTTIKDLLFA